MNLQKLNNTANYFIYPLKYINTYWLNSFDRIVKERRPRIERLSIEIDGDFATVLAEGYFRKESDEFGKIEESFLDWGYFGHEIKINQKKLTYSGKAWWVSKRKAFRLRVEQNYALRKGLFQIVSFKLDKPYPLSSLLYATSKIMWHRTIKTNMTKLVRRTTIILRALNTKSQSEN